MEKFKYFFTDAIAWYQDLSPNWKRVIQVSMALLAGFAAGKLY